MNVNTTTANTYTFIVHQSTVRWSIQIQTTCNSYTGKQNETSKFIDGLAFWELYIYHNFLH